MAKKKKLLKKLAKAALIGGALYGGSKLLKGAKKGYKNVHETGAISQTPGSKWGPWVGGKTHTPRPYLGGSEGPITLSAKGGRIGAKRGGSVKSMGIAKRGGGAAKR
jgi:hypothetical protein